MSLSQEYYPEKVDHLVFQLVFSVLYFTILFSAIFGNLCVVYVVSLKQVPSIPRPRLILTSSSHIGDPFLRPLRVHLQSRRIGHCKNPLPL